ncbi:MAG TPA: hypothetical protein VLV86_22465, partial [Vicinamibacterales bacterium]|nr:hypothetical protein [Vicinamibacterales bacterium]
RAIAFALFGLLAWSGTVIAQGRVAPPPPRAVPAPPRPPLAVRPLFPFGVPRVGVPWFGGPTATLWDFTPRPYPLWNLAPWPYPAYPTWTFTAWPTFVYGADAISNRPELVFNDGTTYIVRDYWRVDDQLHFVTIEEGGTKSVEHTVPLADLDVQRTSDADTARGFLFVLRDEPIEQWLRDH